MLNKREIIVSVAGVFISHERSFQMLCRRFVFTASIKGETERDVRRSETRITLQCFEVGQSRFTLFTLLVERESFDVALLRARGIFRIGKRARSRFEIRIVIDGGIRAVLK